MRSAAGTAKTVYRSIFTSDFNRYDDIGSSHTKDDICLFCWFAGKKEPTSIVFEDEYVLIFEDIRKGAKEHLLCIPKRHIRDINHLKK